MELKEMTLREFREEEEAKKKIGWIEEFGLRERENSGMIDEDMDDAEWFGLLDDYKKGLYTRKQWNKIIESAMIEIGGTDKLTKEELQDYTNFKEIDNEVSKKAELLKERVKKIKLYKQQIIELEKKNEDCEEEIEKLTQNI